MEGTPDLDLLASLRVGYSYIVHCKNHETMPSQSFPAPCYLLVREFVPNGDQPTGGGRKDGGTGEVKVMKKWVCLGTDQYRQFRRLIRLNGVGCFWLREQVHCFHKTTAVGVKEWGPVEYI